MSIKGINENSENGAGQGEILCSALDVFLHNRSVLCWNSWMRSLVVDDPFKGVSATTAAPANSNQPMIAGEVVAKQVHQKQLHSDSEVQTCVNDVLKTYQTSKNKNEAANRLRACNSF